MKICHYNDKQVGAVVGDRVHPLGETLVKAGHLKPGYTMLEVVERLSNEPAAMKCARFALQSVSSVPLASVRLLAPLVNPPAIWAAASNYRAHEAEMRDKMGSYDRTAFSKDDLMAEFFLKPAASIVGPGGPVILPGVSRDVDFECELCAVIGRTARRVAEDRALEHVFGYTILWDFSQRDPWGRGRQNTRNIRKGFDTFTGLGPWIVTRDEVDDPQNLAIRVEQNGRPAMSAHTSDMICTLREHIRFLSAVTTLAAGALISTGTPAGVAKLAPGDRLKGSIERIGEMEVEVQAERP
jgi:2-keto-4-pentenoate hydratase/2-oxohepta-3-ene-1,7-dioic acid hydratase in catechol pathway